MFSISNFCLFLTFVDVIYVILVLGVLPLPDGAEAEERSTNGLISTQETLENAKQILNGEKVDSLLLQKLQSYLGKVNTSYL